MKEIKRELSSVNGLVTKIEELWDKGGERDKERAYFC